MILTRQNVGAYLFPFVLAGASLHGVSVRGQDAKPVVPAKLFRLHLADGSMIVGEPTIDEIVMETEFGTLKIPVQRIRGFTPGLDSRTLLAEKIRSLIEELGADDYQTRELAHKEILRMGVAVRDELDQFSNDGNAERKRHVQAIQQQFARLEERHGDQAYQEGGEAFASSPLWKRKDTVATDRFELLGKISPAKFTIRAKYGDVTVELADVVKADRGAEMQEVIRKRVVISGENVAQRGFKNSKLLLRRGDRVNIKADGQIRMTNWGGGKLFSSPDGGDQFRWYVENEIPGGTLIAKIGAGGKEFKVGSMHSFVAERSGTLRLALAMTDPYGKKSSRTYFPGHYDVDIEVVRK